MSCTHQNSTTVIIYDGKLDEAESELKAVNAESDELELTSLYNLGALHYLKKDWSQAKVYFESVFSRQKENEFQLVIRFYCKISIAINCRVYC